jgi:hypothetical protein
MNHRHHLIRLSMVTWVVAALVVWSLTPAVGRVMTQQPPAEYEFNDSHFHLTNYVQKGIDVHQFLEIMGTRVGRSTLFGIPLQQQWSYANSGDFAPTYYLQSDAPLYYYSFTDAYIAVQYRGLSREEQARFDPMITGFNPADMYAADHIRRVLQTFPGVFTGFGNGDSRSAHDSGADRSSNWSNTSFTTSSGRVMSATSRNSSSSGYCSGRLRSRCMTAFQSTVPPSLANGNK